MSTETDKAHYPFLPEARKYVEEKIREIDELRDESYAQILRRAEDRLKQAIEKGYVSSDGQPDSIEIASFPLAVYLATIIGDDWLKRRFALAETKRASDFLVEEEDQNKIIRIASRTFGWNIQSSQTGVEETLGTLRIDFRNYIKNAMRIRDLKWKLTNRFLNDGLVEVTRRETIRLLEEEIQSRILSLMRDKVPREPDFLGSAVKEIGDLIRRRKGDETPWELPRVIVPNALPPCIRNIYDAFQSGRHISHIGRFALTSFLVNLGVSHDDILLLFKTTSDFDERKTRYQVEHIAGVKGSRTRYTPPKCTTLRTHGLCVSPDRVVPQYQSSIILL